MWHFAYVEIHTKTCRTLLFDTLNNNPLEACIPLYATFMERFSWS
jgi:hypothetical protein